MSPDAAYYRAWRAAHPDYGERQNVLRRIRRALVGREDRTKEYRSRKSRAVPGVEPFQRNEQHELFDNAEMIAGIRFGSLTSLYDPLWDDLVSEAVLALLEQEAGNPVDPKQAVEEYRKKEQRWGRITAELPEER